MLALKVLHDAVATSAVPGPLRTLVDRTLAKDPGLRPSASEVMAVVAESWRERHGQPAIAAADAATDIITRLDRTWVMPAAEPAWPTVQPSAPAAGTRRAALIAATVVIVLGAATAIAVNNLPAQPNPPPVQARSATATADIRASQAATDQRDPAPKRTDRRPPPPPDTSAELAAALDLALASTPAASFTFEGGFTQSLTGGKASGRLHNRETQDDFDMTIGSV
ncbi:hypothetical protein [Nonomuraea sp. NPDC048916]|uniref:hypothetical protein n=1 Tax=Nonomuraea sp. NPDC048916 TaxID=3154232 RepID=UPI0033F40F9B